MAGFSVSVTPNMFIHWECWNGSSTNKRICKGLRLIWHVAVWSIWRARNDCIFKYSVHR